MPTPSGTPTCRPCPCLRRFYAGLAYTSFWASRGACTCSLPNTIYINVDGASLRIGLVHLLSYRAYHHYSCGSDGIRTRPCTLTGYRATPIHYRSMCERGKVGGEILSRKAGDERLELPQRAPKTRVLPLDESPIGTTLVHTAPHGLPLTSSRTSPVALRSHSYYAPLRPSKVEL